MSLETVDITVENKPIIYNFHTLQTTSILCWELGIRSSSVDAN